MNIETTKGMIDEGSLERREGFVDNDHEYTTWLEYWLDGELVHRSAHVTIKEGIFGNAIGGQF